MVVAPKTPPRETPNLSPCVCLEPKKKTLTFFFLTSAAQCTALPLLLIQKHAHTHVAFIYNSAASHTSILNRIEAAFHALQDKPIMGFAIVCGLAPKGAVHLTASTLYSFVIFVHCSGFILLLFFNLSGAVDTCYISSA